MLAGDIHQDLIEPDLDISSKRIKGLSLISPISAGLDFRADDAVFLRDEAGDDAVVGAAGVEEADLVVAEEEGPVLGYHCYGGPCKES